MHWHNSQRDGSLKNNLKLTAGAEKRKNFLSWDQ